MKRSGQPAQSWRFGLCLLLAVACAKPRTQAPSASPSAPTQEIKGWKMSSIGTAGPSWNLSASSARQQQTLWLLQDLRWQSPQSKISLSSPQAIQQTEQLFKLQPLTMLGPGLKANSPEARLLLKQQRVEGQQLELQGSGWSLKARSYQATFPLRHWHLSQVHARFDSGR